MAKHGFSVTVRSNCSRRCIFALEAQPIEASCRDNSLHSVLVRGPCADSCPGALQHSVGSVFGNIGKHCDRKPLSVFETLHESFQLHRGSFPASTETEIKKEISMSVSAA